MYEVIFSIVSKSGELRRSKLLAAAIEAEAPVLDRAMAHFAHRSVFIFGQVCMGYFWVFPKANHLPVGIDALKPGRRELQRTLLRVMSRNGISLDDVTPHGRPLPGVRGIHIMSLGRKHILPRLLVENGLTERIMA